jgi:predicted enzyme related to lactoylglutathione lyase
VNRARSTAQEFFYDNEISSSGPSHLRYRLARSFYLDWLAFRLVWEHRTEDGGPCIIEVSRDDATLLLSEHYGDGSPAAKVLIAIDDVDALHRELTDRRNIHMRPGVEITEWGRILTVIDPFGNRLVFVHRTASKHNQGLFS